MISSLLIFRMYKSSTPWSRIIKPLSRAFKNILSPCNKAFLNVVLDHEFSGIFRAVRSADKLIKAHCFPLEWTLKRSSPWWISAEKIKPYLIPIFLGNICVNKSFASAYKSCKTRAHGNWSSWMRAQHKKFFEHTPHFPNWLGAFRIAPELRHLTGHPDRQTDRHKSRFDST